MILIANCRISGIIIRTFILFDDITISAISHAIILGIFLFNFLDIYLSLSRTYSVNREFSIYVADFRFLGISTGSYFVISHSSIHSHFLLNNDLYMPIIPRVSRIISELYHYNTLKNAHIFVHLLFLRVFYILHHNNIHISSLSQFSPISMSRSYRDRVNKKHFCVGFSMGIFGIGISHTVHVRMMRARIFVSADALPNELRTDVVYKFSCGGCDAT